MKRLVAPACVILAIAFAGLALARGQQRNPMPPAPAAPAGPLGVFDFLQVGRDYEFYDDNKNVSIFKILSKPDNAWVHVKYADPALGNPPQLINLNHIKSISAMP